MTKPKAKFRHRGTVPPVGWIYEIEHEGTKFFFQSPMKAGLFQQLREWHQAKGLDWPGDREMLVRVEDFICQFTPKGFCVGGPGQPKVPFLSASRIRDATRLFMGRIFKGEGRLVDAKEAERRALICANCPQNLHGICTSCLGNTEFASFFSWLLAHGRSTSYDQALDTCSVCGCLLRAKVHFSIDELSNLEKKTYPENCWLHGTACHKDSEED